MGNLQKYNSKRNFNKTSEPQGLKSSTSSKLHYCLQHHLARRDHYDLRLEMSGVLLSWAIPKGPSFNPNEKRLAIQVEDHPLSYRRFEGTIPKGEYGGGTVMLFDEGYYEPLGDFPKDYLKGHIKFKLKGKRLKGAWSLVKVKENNWLLIKEKDKYANQINLKSYQTSIKTNRTMSQITQNKSKPKTSKKEAIVCGIKITNPNKVIFKNPKVTKLDIALYYHKVAKKMLPLIKNRLISTIRAPEGLNGPQFFKKHFNNPYLGKVKIRNSQHQKEDYYYIKDEQGLIYEVQMNSYEFHIWGSKVESLNYPDMLIFDLDPDTTLSLKKVQKGVQDLKKVLSEFHLKAKLKTSGGKGYHLIVYLDSQVNWQTFREIAKNIAQLMEERFPNQYTSNIRLEERQGKIFIDWVRNTKSATSVAPYSLRLKPKAPISYPISFAKLSKTNPKSYTIKDFLTK